MDRFFYTNVSFLYRSKFSDLFFSSSLEQIYWRKRKKIKEVLALSSWKTKHCVEFYTVEDVDIARMVRLILQTCGTMFDHASMLNHE